MKQEDKEIKVIPNRILKPKDFIDRLKGMKEFEFIFDKKSKSITITTELSFLDNFCIDYPRKLRFEKEG